MPDDDRPDWLPAAAILRAVIPVVQETGLRQADGRRLLGRLVVTSIELWADHVVMQYVVSAHDFKARERSFDVALSLSDDVGTEYHHTSGGGGGGSNDLLLVMNQSFSPAVPTEATRLVISFPGADASMEVPLPPDRP